MINLLVILFSVSGMIVGGIVSNQSVDDLSVVSYQLNDAPVFLQDKKIVHLSDLHNHDVYYGEKNLENLIREEEPDFLFLTGDFVDEKTIDLDVYDWLFALVSEIPTYYVHGNHEYAYADYEMVFAFESRLRENNGVILTGKNIEISPGIYLSGIPDISKLYDPFDEEFYLELITNQLEEIPEEGYTIVLTHRPSHFRELVNLGANLIFCGHTHGGQINLGLFSRFLFWLSNPFERRYFGGLFTYKKGVMINSRGLGQTAFPFRYQVDNELIIVTFK
ncbi:MAG: metallophosphoesterase [Bacilli bacterium]